MSTLSFKHSGTTGDLIYSLPIVQHLGGGEFYLHMDQINWMSKYYYNVDAPDFHKGRMNLADFDFLKDFMLAQKYITKFEPLDPKNTAITHNLDNFRLPFLTHPGNYVDLYAETFGISDPQIKEELRGTQWITTPGPLTVEGRDVVINRTQRWIPSTLSPLWKDWAEQGVPQRAMFLGLKEEYDAFVAATGWVDTQHQLTNSLLEIAQYIEGAKIFIGNQSVALSVAIGLGHKDIWCEARRDLPIERNECYFPKWQGLHYF